MSAPDGVSAAPELAPGRDESRLERRVRLQRRLLEGGALLQGQTLDDELGILALAAEVLCDVLDGEPGIRCYLADEATGELHLRWRRGPATSALLSPVSVPPDAQSITAQTARLRRPQLRQDQRGEAAGAGATGRFSVLSLPLVAGGVLLGVLDIYRPAGRPFDDEDLDATRLFVNQTAAALQNARRYARLLGRAEQQVHRIRELQGLTADLVSELDLDAVLARICRTLADLLDAERTGVHFLNERGDGLALAASYGFSPELAERLARTPAPAGPDADCALAASGFTAIPDVTHVAAWERHALLAEEGIAAVCVVPIVGRGQQSLGVLFATWSAPHEPGDEEVEIVRTYANYAAAAIENARLFSRVRELYLASIQSLSAAVDACDAYTYRHSRNVAFYAREMAEELRLPQPEVENIELAALLHDIGKIGIADAILSKPGKLSTDEMSIMITHAAQGAAILSANQSLAPLVPLVRHHHEWYNGRGYPDGLAGEAIPLGAAIISVADAFDTMTTDRSYRRARSLATAAAELERSAGQQFNPRVVAAFLNRLRRDEATHAPYVARLQALHTTELWDEPTLAEANQEEEAGQIRPQRLRELAVLHYLAREVGAITDLPRFLKRTLEVIRKEFGDHDCALLLVDDTTGDLVAQAVSGFDPALKGRRQPAGQGFTSLVLAQGRAQAVGDLQRDPRHAAWRPSSRSAIAAPLISAGARIGVINIESERPDAFNADDEATLETIANQLATAIAVARLHDREKRAAITDELTGVYNHRYFYHRLEEELDRAARGDHPLAVMILDVNGLKALNDTHGHLAGDAALRTIGRLLRECTRRVDIVARYGGDEFAVILPDAQADDTKRLLDRLQTRLLLARTTTDGALIGPFAISVGVASYPTDGTRAAALVAAADQRMYEHKRASAARRAEAPARQQERRSLLDRLTER
ncbi:MAG TPA: GAF domain-containing protein [Thermomicrobiales bacterium]|nr:GAF domain-containing protein [Thermomicrobiales bacterium]